MARVLSIIAPQNFQQIEYLDSKKALEEAGHAVVTASTVKNPTDKRGQAHKADLFLSEVNPADYNAILFVGGPGVYSYFDDPVVLGLARDFFAAGKLTTAICAAPTILARTGLLKGRKATSFPSEIQELKRGGAHFSSARVEQDGLIITGDGPESAYAFGKAISEALRGI